MNTNNTIMGEIAKNMSTNNMIMSEIAKAPENYEDKKEALQSAIDNQKMIESMARYKAAHTPIVKKYKINRNDKCPCGSGLKFKNCCIDKPEYNK